MKTLKQIGLVLLIFSMLSNCKKNEVENRIINFKGSVQKGPFQAGSTITISELDNDLNPTGRNFYTTVADRFGNFNLPNVVFKSNYVELMADGFYYNERWGLVTEDKLVLKAIADISDSATVNVNILTHITIDRLTYLVQNEKKSFFEAKKQSQNEVLNIFNLASNDSGDFEHLDISKKGELNNKLLAISLIMQGNRRINSITELLTGISLDIKEDGTLDSKKLQSDLITSAIILNDGYIRKMLTAFYEDTIFGSFHKYPQVFIDSSNYQPYFKLNFPKNINNEINILSIEDNSIIEPNIDYIISSDNDYYISISIQRMSTSGDIKFIENNLTDCRLDMPYCDSYDGCASGNGMWLDIFTNTSKVPMKLKVKGTGEMMVRIYCETPKSDNGVNFIIQKYLKW